MISVHCSFVRFARAEEHGLLRSLQCHVLSSLFNPCYDQLILLIIILLISSRNCYYCLLHIIIIIIIVIVHS